MIKIEKIFFCDRIEGGQYGKLNITGLIPTNILNFDKTPYLFTTFLVITGKTDTKPEKLSVIIRIKNEKSNIIENVNFDIPTTEQIITEMVPLYFINPLQINIKQFGSLSIDVIQKGTTIYKENYKITKGLSPNIKITNHLPVSKIFHENDQKNMDFVINLLGTTSQSLKIFDDYIDPASLKILMSKVPTTVNIQIITLPMHKKIFLNDQFLSKHFKDIEIRISDKNHDRFVTINDSEYFHFGHSLKDIAGKKLSRCSKMTAQNEVNEYKIFFDNTWNESKKI